MGRLAFTLATLVIAALSLGPSFAHALEAWPRLTVWSPELWREATVFNAQFMLFAIVGAPLDLGAIVLSSLLAWRLRGIRAFRWAVAGAMLFALGLAVWFAVVAPANSMLATWQPGPVPDNFVAIRNRWEIGHILIAAIKLLGFASLSASALLAPLAAREP